jgi:hypothetical protein
MKFELFYESLLLEGRYEKQVGAKDNYLKRPNSLTASISLVKKDFGVSDKSFSILKPGVLQKNGFLQSNYKKNHDGDSFVSQFYHEVLNRIPTNIIKDNKLSMKVERDLSPDEKKNFLDKSIKKIEDMDEIPIGRWDAHNKFKALFIKTDKSKKNKIKVDEFSDKLVTKLVWNYIHNVSDTSESVVKKPIKELLNQLKDSSPEFIKEAYSAAFDLMKNTFKDILDAEDAKLKKSKLENEKEIAQQIKALQKELSTFDEETTKQSMIDDFKNKSLKLQKLLMGDVTGLDKIGMKTEEDINDDFERAKNAEELLNELERIKKTIPSDEDFNITNLINVHHEDEKVRMLSKNSESAVKTLLAMFVTAVDLHGTDPILKTEKNVMGTKKKDEKEGKVSVPSHMSLFAQSADGKKFFSELNKFLKAEGLPPQTTEANRNKVFAKYRNQFSKIPAQLLATPSASSKDVTVYEQPSYITELIYDALVFPSAPTGKESKDVVLKNLNQYLLWTLEGLVKNKSKSSDK